MHHDTDTLAHWRRALVLERINELCEVTKDREFNHGVKELRGELIVQAIDAWETSEFDQADALCERLEYALNNDRGRAVLTRIVDRNRSLQEIGCNET